MEEGSGKRDTPNVLHGQCVCSKVKFEISNTKPLAQNYCHCQSCRTFHSAASIAAVVFPILVEDGKFSDSEGRFKVVEGEEHLKAFQGKPSSFCQRIFCRECGTRLFNSVPAMKVMSVFPQLFAAGELPFEPQYHCNYGEKVAPVQDGLPKFKGFRGSELLSDNAQPLESK